MNAESFTNFLENAAMALLLLLASGVVWVILKRMASAMRKGVIAAESSLIDGLNVSVSSDAVEIRFVVPQGWKHNCELTLLDDSRSTVETLHTGPLPPGEQLITYDNSTLKATFLNFETEGQALQRRLN